MACLCAPTTHEGSFRCRLHRGVNPIITNNSALNYQKGVCGPNVISDQSCSSYITVRESPSASAPHPFDDDRRSHAFSCHAAYTSQVAVAHHQSGSHMAGSSSSSSSPISPTAFCCTRPPPAKKPPSSSSTPSKSRYLGSPPALSTPCCLNAGSGTSSTNASHAAAIAIMKQHLHSKHSRNHNRSTLRSPADFRIGPSRLSRMVVASAEELPILKEDHYMPNSPQQHSNGTQDMSGAFADARGFAPFQSPMQISLKNRSSVNKFKQSETSCRIVGSKGGSLIMPTVY